MLLCWWQAAYTINFWSQIGQLLFVSVSKSCHFDALHTALLLDGALFWTAAKALVSFYAPDRCFGRAVFDIWL